MMHSIILMAQQSYKPPLTLSKISKGPTDLWLN